jgi:hypothetical protein
MAEKAAITATPAKNESTSGASRRSVFHGRVLEAHAMTDFDDAREPVFRLTSAVHLQNGARLPREERGRKSPFWQVQPLVGQRPIHPT